MKRCGNPNFGKPYPVLRIVASEWEMLLAGMGIEDVETNHARMLRSLKIRRFAERRHNTRYVPEWLLKELGIRVDTVYFGRERVVERDQVQRILQRAMAAGGLL